MANPFFEFRDFTLLRFFFTKKEHYDKLAPEDTKTLWEDFEYWKSCDPENLELSEKTTPYEFLFSVPGQPEEDVVQGETELAKRFGFLDDNGKVTERYKRVVSLNQIGRASCRERV